VKRRRIYGVLEVPGLPTVPIRSEQVAGVLQTQQQRIRDLESQVADLERQLAERIKQEVTQ